MTAIFKITGKENDFTFSLLASGGKALLLGGDYETAQDAEKAIQDVRVGSLMSQQIAAGKTADGEMFFVIKNSDGQIIAKSGLYESQMNFDADLHTVKDMACIAEIESPSPSPTIG